MGQIINLVEIEKLSNEKRELLNCLSLPELDKKEFGQLYLIKLKKQAIVGNHYHKSKEEWLMVISGEVKVLLENVKTGEKQEEVISGSTPKKVRIPPFVAHAVVNLSDEAMLVEYATAVFNPKNEDRFPHQLNTR